MAAKQLEVLVHTVGDAPEGYNIDSISVFPDTVVVRGPRDKVRSLDQILTETVDLSKFIANGKKEVFLISPDKDITTEISIVTADIKVSAVMGQKTFKNVRVNIESPKGFAATLDKSRVTVLVTGPVKTLETMKVADIYLIADGTKLESGEHSLRLKGKFPEGVSIVKTVPERVRVRLVGDNG